LIVQGKREQKARGAWAAPPVFFFTQEYRKSLLHTGSIARSRGRIHRKVLRKLKESVMSLACTDCFFSCRYSSLLGAALAVR
jgi:hypothetical protein